MFIKPMLLTVKKHPFSNPDYIYEPKFDGHRLLLSFENGKTDIYTRHGTNCTSQYPELWHPPVQKNVVLDGEVICLNEKGQVDFELLMRRFQTKQVQKIKRLSEKFPVQFVAFDILSIDGMNVQSYPLWKRKQLLDQLLEENDSFVKVRFIPEQGEVLFEAICDKQLEGMVAKRVDSPYLNQRSGLWNKIINHRFQDVWINGYRKSKLGWTMMIEQNDDMVPVGLLELGVPSGERKAFYHVAKSLVIGENQDFIWLEPRIQVRVRHRGFTSSGKLRVPVFDRFILS